MGVGPSIRSQSIQVLQGTQQEQARGGGGGVAGTGQLLRLPRGYRGPAPHAPEGPMELLATSSPPPPGPLAPALPGQPGTSVHITPHPLPLANFQLLRLPLLCPWARMPAPLSKKLRPPPPPPQAGTGEGAPGQTVSERKETDRKAACLLMPRSSPRAPEMPPPLIRTPGESQ